MILKLFSPSTRPDKCDS